MTEPSAPAPRNEPADPAIRRTWWLLSGTFIAAALVALLRLATSGTLVDWIAAIAIGVAGVAAILHRDAVASLESRRRADAESYARILHGLSRSVSPEAVLGAIVEELASGTGADHLVVVRRRPDARVLEATLVSRRPGIPDARTLLPISDLEDPLEDPRDARDARSPVAVPVGLPVAVAAGVTAGGAEVGTEVPRGSAGAGTAGRAAPAVLEGSRAGRGFIEAGGFAGLRQRALAAIETLGRVREVATGGTDGTLATGRVDPTARRIANRIAARAADLYGLANPIATPLTAGDRLVGAIVLSRRTREPWPDASRRLLDAASAEAAVALARAYSKREAETAAATDALTGLPNRRYFDEFCGLLARRRRADDAVGVLMVDIDHFKQINDRHGHATGDEVLRAVAGAVAATVRDQDVPARIGGEEFAVLLRNPGDAIAAEVGERVRVSVRGLDLRALGVGPVSVSVGVAVSRAADEPITAIIDRADRALYRAKRSGRDRVVAA